MPHRTTYFFPRQFPVDGYDPVASKRLLPDQGKKTLQGSFNVENDQKTSKTVKEVLIGKNKITPELFTGKKRSLGKQLLAFGDQFLERKGSDRSIHVNSRFEDEEKGPLLEPEQTTETIVSREQILGLQDSSTKFSGESSYDGSLLSETMIVDENVRPNAKDSQLSTRRKEEDDGSKESLAQKSRDSFSPMIFSIF